VESLDVTDREAFLALADRHEVNDIVHLAGSPPDEDPVGFFRTEPAGLRNARDAARAWGVRRFAVAGSLGVYIGRSETRRHEELARPTAALPHLIVAFKKAVEPLTTRGPQGRGSSRSCSGSGLSGRRSATRSHRSFPSRPTRAPCSAVRSRTRATLTTGVTAATSSRVRPGRQLRAARSFACTGRSSTAPSAASAVTEAGARAAEARTRLA
jgi:hypothetical protein